VLAFEGEGLVAGPDGGFVVETMWCTRSTSSASALVGAPSKVLSSLSLSMDAELLVRLLLWLLLWVLTFFLTILAGSLRSTGMGISICFCVFVASGAAAASASSGASCGAGVIILSISRFIVWLGPPFEVPFFLFLSWTVSSSFSSPCDFS